MKDNYLKRITLLQLDTHFPRIPGDVGSVDTFKCDLEIIRVPNATVKEVVNSNPNQIDLDPFFNAINKATGDLITTSCGFLSPFQSELDAICNVTIYCVIACTIRAFEKYLYTT